MVGASRHTSHSTHSTGTWDGPLRSGGLIPVSQWEKLGGQAGWDPGLLTSGGHTIPSVMLLSLAFGGGAYGERQPGPGYWPSEHAAPGAALTLQ